MVVKPPAPLARSAALVGLSAAVAHGLPSVAVLATFCRAGAERLGPVRLRGPERGAVALTFDDGPDPQQTPRVLENLDLFGLKATFFVTGAEMVNRTALVRELVDRGHEVGTHGQLHEHHLLHGPGWVRCDLENAVESLRRMDIAPRFVRPPFGQPSAGTLVAARQLGLEVVLWSAWGKEFATPTAEAVTARVRQNLRPGAIVLLHDSDRNCGPGASDAVVAALPRIAAELAARELRAVTLSELLA